ncbi:general transcription factor 3C polypeptide 2 isoform X2 [Ranitomeya variabilis]|uniref:general transcription factor 3C polypeptide 2 isoform X2 n=1 Tax=Ranitomeya variabilis TaxID=490064 RepID=UPI00405640CC
MDGSELEDCDTLSAEVMIISREDENLPSPAVLPLGVSAPTTGVTMQESVAPLIPSCKKSLGVYHSPVNTAALPSDNPQKKPLSSLPLSQDILLDTNGPTLMDGSDRCLVAEDSASVPQTPTSNTKCSRTLEQSRSAMTDTEEPSTPCPVNVLQNSPLLSQRPVKVPKSKGCKSKSKMKMTQLSTAPLIPPPDRKGLGVIQSPVKSSTVHNDSIQKKSVSTIPASQDVQQSTEPSSDFVAKSLADEDSLLQQTPVKVPKKRGRKSKAELLLIKAAQELEAQTLVEKRESDSENVEVELTPSGRPRRRAAKTAMKHFQDIVDEWEECGPTSPPKLEKKLPEDTGKKQRRKRKRDESDDDMDFVVSDDILEQEEEVEDVGLSEEESDSDLCFNRKSGSVPGEVHSLVRGYAENGLHNTIMAPVWSSARITMDFREAQYSDWEYPEWIPHADRWHFLSHSEAEIYLPLQTTSPPFCIRREGLKEDSDPHILGRFQSLPTHPQRFDATFFVGGPVWSLDWCPTLWGSSSSQYVALYCHRGMDDRHRLELTYTGPALLQLWCLGALSPDQGVVSAASLSYGLAVDDGCIWDLKFCPSGGWEPPGTPRKGPEMARLGLLAAALSSGHVQIYSLPHPESLHSHRKTQGKDLCHPSVFKVDCVVRLHVGSVKACGPGDNGQCFTVAWMPTKPHQYLAAGFYDGLVAIWDLKTKSVLQRVRQGRVIKQYPFHSFSAHDGAVRSIEWCKADSNFVVTCGSDRRLKFWDLRRLQAPVNNIRRFQGTELAWLLPYCGVAVAQDNCYASHCLCGIHYVDSGFLGYKPYFAMPRKGTVWSVSGSDWLSSVTSGDSAGEVVVVMFPNLNGLSVNTKRPSERRFPVYKVDFLSCVPLSGKVPDPGDKVLDEPLSESYHWEHFKPKSFRAACGRFSLVFQDMDLTNFHNLGSREPVKNMQANELKGDLNMERVQLEAIQKVRFNPNLDAYPWIVSGGHSGLVRVHCVQGLLTSVGQKMIQEKIARFQAKCEVAETARELEYSSEVQHCVVQIEPVGDGTDVS